MQKLFLPTLSSPFPLRLNNYASDLEQYSLNWVNQFNLLTKESDYKRFCKAQFSFLAASSYPDCQLEELKIANDWISSLFIWDEQCDLSDLTEQPQLLENYQKRFLEILQGAEPTNHDLSISYAFFNIRQRMIELGGSNYLPYFVQSVAEYFQGCVQEAYNRVNSTMPDINNYIALRRRTGAVDIVIELTIFCNHLILPDWLRKHQLLRTLKQMTNHILCWDNDIYSAYREIESGDIHNLVFVISHQKKISLPQAFQLAAKMREKELQNLLRLEASLPSFGKELDTEVTKYISGLHAWISGNLNWYSRTARYDTTEILTQLAS